MLVGEPAQVKGSDFEAVDSSPLMADPDSGRAGQGGGRVEQRRRLEPEHAKQRRGLGMLRVDPNAPLNAVRAEASSGLQRHIRARNSSISPRLCSLSFVFGDIL